MLPLLPYKLEYAEKYIQGTYNDSVTINGKLKPLKKFGENTEVGTGLTSIMTLPSGETEETLVSANDITTIVSSSGSDTGTVTIEGHTLDSGVLTFVIQTTTLTGQTGKTLDTALIRVTRVYSTSAASFVGNISVYEGGAAPGGVPTTATEVHLIVPAGQAQSQKASTSISDIDYWIITSFSAGVLKKTSAFAQVRVESKPYTSAIWRPLTEYISVSNSSGQSQLIEDPVLIVPKGYDVRMVAIADAASTHVVGAINGYLASVNQTILRS